MVEYDDRDGARRDAAATEPWFPVIFGLLLLISAGALVWMLVFRR